MRRSLSLDHSFTPPALESLESRLLLTAVPVISEFLASNKTGITDYQGDHSDWIEICNPSTEALDLTGWKLKDSNSTWVFPAVTLGPGEFRIVFASGRNLTDPAGVEGSTVINTRG